MYNYQLFIHPARKTYCESATSDDYVAGIHKDTRARILNLAIVSKAKDKRLNGLIGLWVAWSLTVGGVSNPRSPAEGPSPDI